MKNVTVTTEVGYCPFCRRSRTLRREVRHLGALVRTNIDCETCHRTLSSTMSPQEAEPVAAETAEAAGKAMPEPAREEEAPKPVKAPVPTRTRKPAAARKRATATRPTNKKK
jgi:hypothetical protein